MEKNIARLGSKLTLEEVKYGKENFAGKEFDLSGHEGERARVHAGEDGELTIETRARQKVLVCELDVPEIVFEQEDTGEVDDHGEKIYRSKKKDLDITTVNLKEYIEEKEVLEIK